MISITFLLLLVVIIAMTKAVYGSLRSPIFFYCVIWCIVGAVANLGFYGYYLPSTLVNIIMFVGIIVFWIVYGVYVNGFASDFFKKDFEITETNINLKSLLFINIIFLILVIPTLITSIGLIRQYGLWYIRANASEVYNSGLLATLSDSVIRPTFISITLITIISCFCDVPRGQRKLLIVLSVIDNVVMTFQTGGRAAVVNFVFYMLIALVLFKGESFANLIRTQKKKIIFLIVVFIFILQLTQMRSTTELNRSDFLRTFYTYYFSGPEYLTQLIENVQEYGINGAKFYGAATFGFITTIFSDIMILLTGRSQGAAYIISSRIANKQYTVGSGGSLVNAMCTGFYPAIVDWGYFGIVLGPAVIAIITGIVTRRVYQKTNIFNTCLYIYILYTLFRTVFKYDLLGIDFSVIILFTYIFTKNPIREMGA